MLIWLPAVLTAAPAGVPAPLPDAAAQCLAAARQAAAGQDLPEDLLVGIALTESGRRRGGQTVPWPWTVNAAGRGWWFDTRDEAIAHVRSLQRRDVRSIDVGCFQVNLHWHRDAFASLEEAFDPVANADYAALFLTRLVERVGQTKAVGHYHSATPSRSVRYREKVASRREHAIALLTQYLADTPQRKGGLPRPGALLLFARNAGPQAFRSLFGAPAADAVSDRPGGLFGSATPSGLTGAGRGIDPGRSKPVGAPGQAGLFPTAAGPSSPPK